MTLFKLFHSGTIHIRSFSTDCSGGILSDLLAKAASLYLHEYSTPSIFILGKIVVSNISHGYLPSRQDN